jgi:hypothetical protein
LVEIDEITVQAELVEVAAGRLDPSGVGDPARLQRVEGGGADEPFDGCRSRVVVRGVEEHGPAWLAVCALARLVIETAWRIDHGKAGTVQELFADEGQMNLGQTSLKGREEIREMGAQAR